MHETSRRSGLRLLGALLFKGQQVDWRYSLVVILVITGMFSTPLALGSIRNRVYAAVKEQIEKENNAREVSLDLAREGAPLLDDHLVSEIEARFPGLDAVGNYKLIVSVEGPESADLLTLQTLEPGDPRTAPLGIVPAVPEGFGLADLVISDSLGRLLYGDRWDALWNEQGEFSGGSLVLAINELPLSPEFRVVARRTLPGRGLYASPAAGAALRRYTLGFGSPELSLPVDEGLVSASLPGLSSESCLVLLSDSDPTCGPEAREAVRERWALQHHEVSASFTTPLPPLVGWNAVGVHLRDLVEDGSRVERRSRRGDCREILAPNLVNRCTASWVLPDLTLEVTATNGGADETSITISGLPDEARPLLPEWQALRDLHGEASPSPDRALELVAPFGLGFGLGEGLWLHAGQNAVPARVHSFYSCGEGNRCPWLTDPLSLFRLQNLVEGLIEVTSYEPLTFVPATAGTEYDQVLAYVPDIEQVEAVAAELRELYPGYNVQYNAAALDKLRRQDSRLSTLFTLTMTLSAIFLALALAALARINLERRSRQMAQMLILGFERRFVRQLVVAEYLLLTVVSALASLALTALLCATARTLLRSTASGSASRDFEVIIESMSVDPAAFLLVFAVVALCTWAIAVVTAQRAARSDPLTLLD